MGSRLKEVNKTFIKLLPFYFKVIVLYLHFIKKTIINMKKDRKVQSRPKNYACVF